MHSVQLIRLPEGKWVADYQGKGVVAATRTMALHGLIRLLSAEPSASNSKISMVPPENRPLPIDETSFFYIAPHSGYYRHPDLPRDALTKRSV